MNAIDMELRVLKAATQALLKHNEASHAAMKQSLQELANCAAKLAEYLANAPGQT